MVRGFALLAGLPLAAAYPWAMDASTQFDVNTIQKRSDNPAPVRDPLFLSGRENIGGFTGPPAPFDAEAQLVDVSDNGPNPFRAPARNARRGQCPGLNAAANHGFLPRDGLPSITQTVVGLRKAYNMNEDLSLFLAVLSVGLAGDFVTQRWSIGGSFPAGPLGLGLLGTPAGIEGTHNRYEGDASIVRGDAFLNGGNVGVFQMRSWNNLWNVIRESGGNNYGFDQTARQNEYTSSWSLQNNPHYFSGPFSGLVTPAAHNFVVAFMSNHSAENNGGFLTRDVLKSFFAVEGNAIGQFRHRPRQERIPLNWYKRAALNSYTIPSTVADVQVSNLMYPGTVRFGGNTGTVNSFVGVDLSNLTGGVFSGPSLFEGNNAACFLLQASQAGLPDAASNIVSGVGSLLSWMTEQLGPLGENLGCPQLATFRNGLFSPFPGFIPG